VALHDLALLAVELARLEEHAVGDPDLADVVQRARVAEQLGVRDAPPDLAREALAEEADALDVRAGVAVARLGRLGEPADVAAAVRLLASAEANFITGHTLVVDGGLTS
jgi:NAD(P)-dependent dehydrogenase (short-subunit alcohol dehydrogenase family)